jgi:hypothetical protein
LEPIVPASLAAKLNQNTPHAPANEDEAARRLSSARPRPAPPVPSNENLSQGLSSVFVPTVREVRPDERPQYELRVMEDGTPGFAVYTSVDLLKQNLGPDQPWSEAPLLELLYLVGRERVGVALNPRHDPDLTGDGFTRTEGGS